MLANGLKPWWSYIKKTRLASSNKVFYGIRSSVSALEQHLTSWLKCLPNWYPRKKLSDDVCFLAVSGLHWMGFISEHFCKQGFFQKGARSLIPNWRCQKFNCRPNILNADALLSKSVFRCFVDTVSPLLIDVKRDWSVLEEILKWKGLKLVWAVRHHPFVAHVEAWWMPNRIKDAEINEQKPKVPG